MVILDTDHLSVLERQESKAAITQNGRLEQLPEEDIAVTIISFEEQVRGGMTTLARAKAMTEQIKAYRRLNQLLDNYSELTVLDFDENAAIEFQRLKKKKIRIGTMDLKIAAIALSRKATVLSRNLSDFTKVPDLLVEDWSKQEN